MQEKFPKAIHLLEHAICSQDLCEACHLHECKQRSSHQYLPVDPVVQWQSVILQADGSSGMHPATEIVP